MNKKVTYSFSFQINLLIFENVFEFFQFFLHFWKICLQTLKDERNVTIFGYILHQHAISHIR